MDPEIIKKFNFEILEDYFIYDNDDIKLSQLQDKILKNLKTYDLSESKIKEIEGIYSEMLSFIQKTDFESLNFPFLKNSLCKFFILVKAKLKQNEISYFILILISNLSKIRSTMYNYYYMKIQQNSFGLPRDLVKLLVDNSKNKDSKQFIEFIKSTAIWYVKNEFIFFLLELLNEFFNVKILLDEKEISLDHTYEFSINTYVKRSIFKLSTIIFEKLSDMSKSAILDRLTKNAGNTNIILLIASSFTYGFSVKDFLLKDYRLYAVLGGIFVHFFVQNISETLTNKSKLCDVENISTVIRKLNKKLEKLRKNIFDLCKLNIYLSFEENSELKFEIENKINLITGILQKYLKNVDSIDLIEKEITKLSENEFELREIAMTLSENEDINNWMDITLKYKNI